MTLFIFCIVLILALIAYNYFLSRKYYLDSAIYELRQSKHDIILYIGNHEKQMNDRELKEIRGLLSMVNHTLSAFTKISENKFSTLKVVIREVIVSSNKLDKPADGIFEKHQDLLKHYTRGFTMAIQTIPFIKIRLIIKIAKVLLIVLVALGIEKARFYLKKIEQLIKAEDNHFNNNHCLMN